MKGIQQAVLHYRVVDSREGFSLVSVQLETGRTHQIRVQFAHRGLPLAGDRKYSKYPATPRSGRSACGPTGSPSPHPATGEAMAFVLPPPQAEPWGMFSPAGEGR